MWKRAAYKEVEFVIEQVRAYGVLGDEDTVLRQDQVCVLERT